MSGWALRDLTQPIRAGMSVYPGDPAVHVGPALALEADGAEVAALRLGSHTGTHVDAPAHIVPGGRRLADVGLDELVGDALVLHIAGLVDDEVCDLDRLVAAGLPESVPAIVVLDLGWARWFDDERRLRHPTLSADAARALLQRGMRVLVVDTLSPDPTGHHSSAGESVHEIVLSADALIVENVCRLGGLPARCRVGFFPLNLAGDGAPVRAVAFLDAPEAAGRP